MHIDINEFTKPCSCGVAHSIVVEDIIIEAGALSKLPELITRQGYKKPLVVCDDNTFIAAGEAVVEILGGCGCVKLDSTNLHADEHGVALLEKAMPSDIDLILAVGSGTIHDIVRFVSHEKKLPFMSIPTAASVDGFVSTVAAMTWNGFKKSFIASSPICVIADSSIFSKAPTRLSASGVSDLLGKYTAIADWRISHLVSGESICERICQIELDAVDTVSKCLDGIKGGNIEAYEKLMYGLLLSGLAMQMIGHSRPASGAEHHMSHLWEMEILNPHIDAYHGEKVGVGLAMATKIYHCAAKLLRDGKFTIVPDVDVEQSLLRSNIKNDEIYNSMIEENTPNPLLTVDVSILQKNAEKIADIVDTIPSASEIEKMLKTVGAPCSLADIKLDSAIAEDSAKLSPYVRSRLTLMRIIKMFDFYGEILKV